MQYQLPTGKVINITIEQYLNLTDFDIQYFVASNSGEVMSNPFTGSALTTNVKEKEFDFSFHKDEDEEKEIYLEDLSEDDINNLEEL
jgi:hypothetical protein